MDGGEGEKSHAPLFLKEDLLINPRNMHTRASHARGDSERDVRGRCGLVSGAAAGHVPASGGRMPGVPSARVVKNKARRCTRWDLGTVRDGGETREMRRSQSREEPSRKRRRHRLWSERSPCPGGPACGFVLPWEMARGSGSSNR